MNQTIKPNNTTLSIEKANKEIALKVALSTVRCTQSVMESFVKEQMVKIIGFNDDIPFAVNRVENIYELRGQYRGQAYQRIPAKMTFSNNFYQLTVVGEDDEPNCYLLLDRRELRLKKRVYRKFNSDELRSASDEMILAFVKDFNTVGTSQSFSIKIKNLQNKLLFSNSPIIAHDAEELVNVIFDILPVHLFDADPLVEEICEELSTNKYFEQC